MSFETGKFEGLKARHAMNQEHTLCGTAHDAGDSGDFEEAGSWVGDPTPKAVSCSDCHVKEPPVPFASLIREPAETFFPALAQAVTERESSSQ